MNKKTIVYEGIKAYSQLVEYELEVERHEREEEILKEVYVKEKHYVRK